MHGTGKYISHTGSYYSGEWHEDKRHGRGIQVDKEGNVKHDGQWNDNKPVGAGGRR